MENMTMVIITISLGAVLFASQIAVIIALIVLYKKFKALKVEVNKYRIKKNRDALPMLTVRRPTAEKNQLKNEYVDGQRHPSTLVRSNSEESVVFVPTSSERRSKSYDDNDDEHAAEGMNDMQNSTGEAITPNIEEININPGYTRDDSDEAEIYGNQVIIDMVKNYKMPERSECGTQPVGSADGCSTKNRAQKEKSQGKTVRGSQNVIHEHRQTSFESESIIVGGERYGVGQDNQDGIDVEDEPIYVNQKQNWALRKS